MATISYRYNAYDAGTTSVHWDNPTMFLTGDGSPGTDYTVMKRYKAVEGAGSENGWYYTTTNTCTGTCLGYITKVEFTINYDGDTNGNTSRCNLQICPEFGGSSIGDTHILFDISNGDYQTFTTTDTDITSDTNHPTWSSDWSHIQNLDLNLYGYARSADLVGAYAYVDIWYGYVKVTYNPTGSFGVV